MMRSKRFALVLGLCMLGLSITYGGRAEAGQEARVKALHEVSPYAVLGKMKLLSAQDFASGKLRGFVIGSGKSVAVRPESFYSDLADSGSNLGRITLNLERCASCDQFEIKPSDLKNLDTIMQMGQKYGFYVVITFGLSGQDNDELWIRPSLQKSLIKTWMTVAARYRRKAAVGGYDLLNEPVPPGLTEEDRQTVWLSYAAKLTKAIKLVDPRHTIIIEAAQGASPTAFNTMRSLPYRNIVYSFHLYMPMEITHQGVSDSYTTSIPYPADTEFGIGVWNKSQMSELIEPVRQFAEKYKVPIYVGEFSCVRWAPDSSAFRYVKDALDLFEQEGWAWTYHEFRGATAWDAENDSPFPEVLLSNPEAPTFLLLKQYFSRNPAKERL